MLGAILLDNHVLRKEVAVRKVGRRGIRFSPQAGWPMSTRAQVEAIRQTADIVSEVERYVSVRRAGKNFVGLCPFHSEKTPSFHASLERGRAHCFGCGWDGDVFAFVMAAKKCTFPQAARILAARYGIALDYAKSAPDAAERRARADAAAWRVYDEIARLRRYYTGCLHRCDRLCASIGKRLRRERNPRFWDSLARLAPAHSFFLAAFQFFATAKPPALARFASASPAERRKFFFEVCDDAATSAAA